MMKKRSIFALPLALGVSSMCYSLSASADVMQLVLSADCPNPLNTSCDGSVQDNYSFNLIVAIDTDTFATNPVYNVTLTNDSSTTDNLGSEVPRIDALFWNLIYEDENTLNILDGVEEGQTIVTDDNNDPNDGTDGTDFTVDITTPSTGWRFDQNYTVFGAQGGMGFQYDGSAFPNSAENRLAPTEQLIFDMTMLNLDVIPDNPLDLFRNSPITSGQQAGGGDDSGQVGVSFTSLNSDLSAPNSDGSDLVTGIWPSDDDNPGQDIPEPGILSLLGLGLLGLGASRHYRRREKSA